MSMAPRAGSFDEIMFWRGEQQLHKQAKQGAKRFYLGKNNNTALTMLLRPKLCSPCDCDHKWVISSVTG